MQQQKSKRIFLYLCLFFIIGTINNKYLNNASFPKINKITIVGLNDKDRIKLINDLNFLKINNLFFLNEIKIKEIMISNSLVEEYTVFKEYPSTLNIKIDKTKFLAQIQKNGIIFFLGSNGKFTKTENIKKGIPFIFGDFKNQNFFELKKAIDETNFKYEEIKNIFFFKSGRSDIEMNSGLLLKLPPRDIKKSINLSMQILDKNVYAKIYEIDLRQYNQIVINGK